METSPRAAHGFEFRGQAGEYFRIWIVNVLLTVLTLGIYSAWAKVRTHKYFYRNTYLDGASFDYLASPIQILKGRLILAAGVALYAGLGYVMPLAQLSMLLLVLLLVPWIMQRALRFRLYNTGYRNLRFHFAGTVGQAYSAMGRGLGITVLTLGFGAPWAAWLRTKYAVDNARYGTSAFSMATRPRHFFIAYYGAFAIMAAVVIVGSLVLSGIMGSVVEGGGKPRPEQVLLIQGLILAIYLPGYLFAWAFSEVRVFNGVINQMQLDEHHFAADMRTDGLAWVAFSSAVAIVLSLGLLLPWAMIRLARYRFDHVRMLPAGELSGFVADQSAQVSAAGDEVGSYLDLDLGL